MSSAVPPPSARNLRLRVVDAGTVRADLTFPATAAAHLADLTPPEVAEKLVARGIEVAAVAASAAERGFPPGDLFTLNDGTKQVRVWLE